MTRSDEQKVGARHAIRNLLVFLAVLAALGGLVAWQRTDAEEACTAKGVDYFKQIESYPYLSDGRSAERVARERCERTTTAFGGS